MMRRPLILLLTILVVQTLPAQPEADLAKLRGESEQTRNRLREAEKKRLAGQVQDAADELQRILDDAGDDLITLDGKHYHPARRDVQRLLTLLPADVLASYRDRVDEPARKLLEQGRTRRDARPLQTLLDRYYASRPAEEAILLLGELAFERGDFREAHSLWKRLLPGSDAAVPYPRPTIEPGSILARMALASYLQGRSEQATSELNQLRKNYPQAKGRLAGKDGLYVDILAELLAQPDRVTRIENIEEGWSSFAGGPSRSGRATSPLPYYWPGRPTWRVPIPGYGAQRLKSERYPTSRSLAFHPVILGPNAYIADPLHVYGFDRLTGEPRVSYDLRSDPTFAGMAFVRGNAIIPTDADYTLTAAEGRLYVRMGPALIAPITPDPTRRVVPPTSVLVALQPVTRDGKSSLSEVWHLSPPVEGAYWEGSPIVHGGRVYAAHVRFEGNRTIQGIACYTDPPGNPLWNTDVADSPYQANVDVRSRHELLTRAGDRIVLPTQRGLVVAVDERTGKIAWAQRYTPLVRTAAQTVIRDLTPPVFHDGRLFVAPIDSDQILAVDPRTGEELWKVGPFLVDQLLGVTHDRLVCTISGPTKTIRGFDVATGSDRGDIGWTNSDDPHLGSLGRGLVADEAILWPSQAHLFFLDPLTGSQLRPRNIGPHGNLAYAGDVLLVATASELWGYVAERAQLPARQAEAERLSHNAAVQGRLARAYADAGQWTEAERALPEKDPALVGTWLTDRAERAWLLGRSATGRDLFRQVSQPEYPRDLRARAVARLGAELPNDLIGAVVYGSNGIPYRLGQQPPSPPLSPMNSRERMDLPELDLQIAAEVALEPGSVPLRSLDQPQALAGLNASSPLLLCGAGPRLLAYRPRSAQPLWQVKFPRDAGWFAAAVRGQDIFAVGHHGVARILAERGQLAWFCPFPSGDPLPRGGAPLPHLHSLDLPRPEPTITTAQIHGSRIIVRWGIHHLLGIDLEQGSILWAIDYQAEPRISAYRPESASWFAPVWAGDDKFAIVQVVEGERWSIDPRTGTRLDLTPTALGAWISPPTMIAPNRLAVADGPGIIRILDTTKRRAVETLDLGGEASWTGVSPGLRAIRQGLLVAVSRNDGVELIRIDAQSSRRAWPVGTAMLPVGQLDLTRAGVDAERIYLPLPGQVRAVSLFDGQSRWNIDLRAEWSTPASSSVVAARGSSVVVVAEEPIANDPLPRLPNLLTNPLGRGPAWAVGMYDAWTARRLPLLSVDATTGEIRHRLDLAAGVTANIDLGPNPVVVTGNRAYWLK